MGRALSQKVLRMRASDRLTYFASVSLLMICCVSGRSAYAQSSPDTDPACSDIDELALPRTRITDAQSIHVSGEYTVPGSEKGMGLTSPIQVHRSFCRVSGVIDPAIHFEVSIPL